MYIPYSVIHPCMHACSSARSMLLTSLEPYHTSMRYRIVDTLLFCPLYVLGVAIGYFWDIVKCPVVLILEGP